MIGDTSQRYVGSILTDSSGNIVPFEHALNRISYLNGYGSTPYNVLSAGSATASTSISLSSYVPVTATVAQLAYLDNSTSGGTCNIQSSVGSNIVLQVQQISSGGRPALYTQAVFDCPCPSQSIAYFNSASGGSKNIDVIGYVYAR
ncbi:MAG TPA: hypothetical protein VMA74_20760 [Dyella sp.]|uniref:hypothetical protein n=1 Tax=Dyella sp. TaxID=1869338 RepID=UPI002CB6CE43|nr:hypothetical protein [Dyella sp.]HUB92168.1 hypothetical protein [Dyella sp.]